MKHKHHGKKTFRQFFWRRFLILFFLFSAGLIGYQCFLYEQYYEIVLDDQRDGFDPFLAQHLESADAEDRADLWLQNYALSKTRDYNMQCGMMLYNPETGEVIPTRPYAFAEIWQNGEKKLYRLEDADQIRRLYDSTVYYPVEAADLIRRLYDSTAYFYPVAAYSIYVKDNRFIPGEVYMRKPVRFAPYRKKEGEPLAGEWVDLSPDPPKGWTKICSDLSKEELAAFHLDLPNLAEEKSADGKLHLGGIECLGGNAPYADALMQNMARELPAFCRTNKIKEEQELKEKVTENDQIQLISHEALKLVTEIKASYRYQRELEPKYVYYRFLDQGQDDKFKRLRIKQDITMQNISFRGETWQLFTYIRLDLLNMLRIMAPSILLEMLCILAVGALLPSLLIGLIWSVIVYLIYSRRYDFRAYRRNLTGALAHDLKTPLAVIYGNAENLRTHAHPENADTYADNIMENVTHMDEMIASVLKLARTEDLTEPLMTQKVDLTALLHAAFLQKETQMQARGLTLTESGSLTVRGNPEMLRQLAENLAANAVQHANENGTVTVSAEKRTLRISNPFSGTLDVKAICEPFRRGDAARGSQSGSGLGLSIVQQIASAHGIRLRIRAKDGIFTAELRKPRFLIKTIRRKDL